MAEPKVRFKRNDGSEFHSWKTVTIGDIFDRQSIPVNVDPDEFYREIGIRSHGKGLFHKEAVQGIELGNKRVFEIVPDCLVVNIVFAWERAVSKTTVEEVGMIASHRFPMYKPKDGILDLDYIVHYLITDKGKQLLELASPGGAGRNRTLGQEEFANSKFRLPCYEEQKKISAFLVDLDEVITASEAEIANLETQKKAVMKKIFSQEVQFKRADGSCFPDWDIVKLSSILTEYKDMWEKDGTYEHVSLTKEGVVPKTERYERDFLVTTEDKKYRVTHYNDICYNPANLKFGVICRNKYGDAIFSPIYVTFTVRENYAPEFVEMLVTNDVFIQRALKYQQGTVYERMAVSPSDLLRLEVGIPCLEEQRYIADFLSDFDDAIAAAKKELELWKELKKGLLQQMFV